MLARGAAGYAQASKEVAESWLRVADVSCTLGFISDTVSDARKLQSMIEIKPLDICDYDFESKATAAEVEIPEAHRPCDALAVKIHLLTDAGPRTVDKCIDQFMPHSNGGTQQRGQQQRHQQQNLSGRGLLLRSSMMLLKLAFLMLIKL